MNDEYLNFAVTCFIYPKSLAMQLRSPVLTAIGLVSGNSIFDLPHRIDVS